MVNLGYTIEKLEIIEDEIKKCVSEERKKNLEIIKENLLKFMRTDFKIINGRDVCSIGYDEEKCICVIHYNHLHSGKTIYYHHVTREQFDELNNSENTAQDAERIFNNKAIKII